MSEHHPPRLFAGDAEVRHVGEGLLACALAREEWTHEAHLGSCAWLIIERPDILPERDLPGIIRRFNESLGGINDETHGYHETITQCFIIAARAALARSDPALPLHARANALLRAREGRRDWPLHLYSTARLFSVPARLGFVAPDLRPLPASITDPERYRD